MSPCLSPGGRHPLAHRRTDVLGRFGVKLGGGQHFGQVDNLGAAEPGDVRMHIGNVL